MRPLFWCRFPLHTHTFGTKKDNESSMMIGQKKSQYLVCTIHQKLPNISSHLELGIVVKRVVLVCLLS